jgi:hypothetical protein
MVGPLDIDKTLIKQFTQTKISHSKLMIELGRHNQTDINNRMYIEINKGTFSYQSIHEKMEKSKNIGKHFIPNIVEAGT